MSARGRTIVVVALVASLHLIAGALVAVGGTTAGVAVSLFAALVVGAGILRGASHRLVLVLMAAAAGTATWNGLRVGDVVTVTDCLLLAAAAVVVSKRLLRPVKSSWRYYRPFLVSSALIFYGGLVGTLFADYAWTGVADLVRFAVSSVGVLALFALWGPSVAAVRVLTWSFLVGASISAALGTVYVKDGAGRAIGLAAHSNHFAVASLLAFGAGVGLFLASRGRSRHVASGLTAIMLVGVVLSGSRAAIAGVTAFFFVVLMMTRQWKLVYTGVAIGTSVLTLVLIGVVQPTRTDALGRLLGEDSTVRLSDKERSEAREEAFRAIESRPLTGVGFRAAKEAHNVYLQVWAAAGLLGAAGGLGFVASAAGLVTGPFRRNGMVAALVSSYVGYLVAAAFSTVLWDRYLWVYVATTLATITAMKYGSSGGERNGTRAGGPRAGAVRQTSPVSIGRGELAESNTRYKRSRGWSLVVR